MEEKTWPCALMHTYETLQCVTVFPQILNALFVTLSSVRTQHLTLRLPASGEPVLLAGLRGHPAWRKFQDRREGGRDLQVSVQAQENTGIHHACKYLPSGDRESSVLCGSGTS